MNRSDSEQRVQECCTHELEDVAAATPLTVAGNASVSIARAWRLAAVVDVSPWRRRCNCVAGTPRMVAACISI